MHLVLLSLATLTLKALLPFTRAIRFGPSQDILALVNPLTMSSFDKDQIVTSVAELYKLVIKIYNLPHDHIQYPPHAFDAEWNRVANQLHLSERTIDLMKSLPCLREDTALNCMTRSINYVYTGTLFDIRDPIGLSEDLGAVPDNPANIGKDDIALAHFAH